MSISTHVLDTSIGQPAAGVAVQLQRRDGEQWIEISRGVTNADGRVAALVAAGESIVSGTYRLTFAVASYFQRLGVESFYADIAIEFIIRDAARYHVPLLVSPFGYSTYRGS